MNAPVDTTPGALVAQLWDCELERNILGAAMLLEPMPPWLHRKHFYTTRHQQVFRAIHWLRPNHGLARVAGLLRKRGLLWTPEMGQDRHSNPGVLASQDLAEMALEARYALGMGWALDTDRLRRLAAQRALVEQMRRVEILVRADRVDAGELGRLEEVLGEMKGLV